MFEKKSGLPQDTPLPKHIAIIMDGNGRWAKKRFLPRKAGHQAGGQAFPKDRPVLQSDRHRLSDGIRLFPRRTGSGLRMKSTR